MYTSNTLPTDGSTGPFPIGINYLSGDTLAVTLTDIDGISNPSVVPFVFSGSITTNQPSGTTFTLVTPVVGGRLVTIKKVIDMDTPVIDWNTSAELSKSNLRKNTINLMEMSQTAYDAATFAISKLTGFDEDAAAILVAAALSASNAASSESSANASKNAALATFVDFEKRYLGAKAANPTLDNTGAALINGALYFNTSNSTMRVYDLPTTTWQIAYVPVSGLLAAANNLSDLPNAAMARTNLGLVIGTNVQAYNVANALLNIVQTFTKAQRGSVIALTDAATITPNFNDGNHFSVTLGGNRTLANPTNLVAGQSGSIFISQDATGTRTLTLGSQWDTIGNSVPVLSTAANAVDRLDYIVRSASSIHCVLSKAWS